MAAIVITNVALAGAIITFAAASVGGDTIANTGVEKLVVRNDDATSKTVTINSITACNQGFDHNVAVVVAAGEEAIIGPFPVSRFSASIGVTYSAVTSVTVAAVKG